ncbi:MAG: hypothetical protein OXU76_01210, partial [Alphaproteobacteria bacterium]|nr:hypothetical protein [Alphaproteobacteria bacterium]
MTFLKVEKNISGDFDYQLRLQLRQPYDPYSAGITPLLTVLLLGAANSAYGGGGGGSSGGTRNRPEPPVPARFTPERTEPTQPAIPNPQPPQSMADTAAVVPNPEPAAPARSAPEPTGPTQTQPAIPNPQPPQAMPDQSRRGDHGTNDDHPVSGTEAQNQDSTATATIAEETVNIYEHHPLTKPIYDAGDSGTFTLTENYGDNALFRITADGRIWWRAVPDYENPKDGTAG